MLDEARTEPDCTEPASTLTGLRWHEEPIAFALREAGNRRLPESSGVPQRPFCTEVGRRLLLAQLSFSDWVLRRVEKARFDHDRTVWRNTSIELRVPDYAPILAGEGGERWLVPLTVMARRTLVNLDLRDEEDRSISLLGLRFTQELDQAMLRAAARLVAAKEGLEVPSRLTEIISEAVTGDRRRVEKAREDVEQIKAGADPCVKLFLDDDLFAATLRRLWSNFTVYVTLPVVRGRHRLLRMSFEEPTDWVYQRPKLEARVEKDGTSYVYQPYARRFRFWHVRSPGTLVGQILARLGVTSTRVRFLTPSAETCASYHFEFTAPPGVKVSRAALVAGRPNTTKPSDTPDTPNARDAQGDPDRRFSVDALDGHGPTVGLHAVEVPSGSLCRAQVDLRVSRRGWLTTLLACCTAILLVVLSVAWHATLMGEAGQWSEEQVTNIVLLLITVSAGAATYVAQHEAREVAARLVTWLRGIGVVAVGIPALTAAWLVYLGERVQNQDLGGLAKVLPTLVVIAGVCWVFVAAAWLAAALDEWFPGRVSPWDMTGVGLPRAQRRLDPRRRKQVDKLNYHDTLKDQRFRKMAVGTYSSEGWHEVYSWSDAKQATALQALEGSPDSSSNLTGCRCSQVATHEVAGELISHQAPQAATVTAPASLQ